MNENTSTSSSTGIGFTGALTIVFVIFKLLGKLGWSWWWVFCPIWISAALAISIIAIYLIAVLVTVWLQA